MRNNNILIVSKHSSACTANINNKNCVYREQNINFLQKFKKKYLMTTFNQSIHFLGRLFVRVHQTYYYNLCLVWKKSKKKYKKSFVFQPYTCILLLMLSLYFITTFIFHFFLFYCSIFVWYNNDDDLRIKPTLIWSLPYTTRVPMYIGIIYQYFNNWRYLLRKVP